MNIRDLSYLIALADHQHFGKAADACFVSQPALSMQIKKLETLLGVQLVERTNKSVLLTDIGMTITQYARDILHQTNTIREVAKQARDPFSGTLQLGIIPTLAPYLLPHIMPSLSTTFPKVTFYLKEERTDDLIKGLQLGKLDAAIIALPITEQELTVASLFNEPFVLATSTSHPLAKKESITLQDLDNQTLLLLEDGHCMREQALSVCFQANAAETKGFQATSLETLRHMVAADAGITLMPTLACTAHKAIQYLPFKSDAPTRTIGLVWRQSSAKQILLEHIADNIKQLMEKTP